MSKILIGANPNNPQVVGSIDFSATNEEKATQLPTPTGYRILCALPEVEKEYESGILKADETLRHEGLLATVLFPSGPWCQVGDFVLVRPNAGTRMKIHGTEMRMINDDSVEGVVLDPRGISRV
jgi:hypothetical protein